MNFIHALLMSIDVTVSCISLLLSVHSMLLQSCLYICIRKKSAWYMSKYGIVKELLLWSLFYYICNCIHFQALTLLYVMKVTC